MAVLIPKLKVPFNIVGTRAQVVDQDSDAEIIQCVLATLRTRLGSRDSGEDVGIPDLAFLENVDVTAITRALDLFEPRALSVLSETEIIDLIRKVHLEVATKESQDAE